MKNIISKIGFVLVIALAGLSFSDEAFDKFFEIVSLKTDYQCSLDIVQYAEFDTALFGGFFAIGGKRLYAHLGENYYLQGENGELLNWMEGGDAMPAADALPFGNWEKTKQTIVKKFQVKATIADDFISLLGSAIDKESPIVKTKITVWKTGYLKEIILWDMTNYRPIVVLKTTGDYRAGYYHFFLSIPSPG